MHQPVAQWNDHEILEKDTEIITLKKFEEITKPDIKVIKVFANQEV